MENDKNNKTMKKVVLTESEQREVDLITEEFKAKGGMDDEELMSRFGAITFEEFSNNIREKIRNYKMRGNLLWVESKV